MIPESKRMSAAEAVKLIRSDDRIFVGSGGAVPSTEETVPYVKPGMESSLTHHALFTGPNVRKAQNEGRTYAIPNHLSNVPDALESYELDVALLQVSPPRKGYFSLGVCVDTQMRAAKTAKRVLVKVNGQMPNVFGDTLLKADEIDAFVAVDRPLIHSKSVLNKDGFKIARRYCMS